MDIPLIVVLIVAEFLLVLLGISITLGIMLLRKPEAVIPDAAPEEAPVETAEDELDAIELGNNYIDFLKQAIDRNTTKTAQQKNIENDKEAEGESLIADDSIELEEAEENIEDDTESNITDQLTSPPPDTAQSQLLAAREQFLLMEKTAAEKTEHDIHFWESIYDGMKAIVENLAIHERTSSIIENELITDQAKPGAEKVFYIETQGKKIDGEVNKLKDIISEQENALSSMKKAMEGAEDEHPGDSESLKALREQMEAIERQLNDSKMCMDVLEMENNRLQEEVDNMEASNNAESSEDSSESDSTIDLEQMKEVAEQQEQKIQSLIDTIESLELDATQTEALKSTISDFARTSKEMLSCITILEEENERLKSSDDIGEEDDTPDSDNSDLTTMQSAIEGLEEDIIKKDVAFAQLQDEFSSMETEYLAMYEAMHGDNS